LSLLVSSRPLFASLPTLARSAEGTGCALGRTVRACADACAEALLRALSSAANGFAAAGGAADLLGRGVFAKGFTEAVDLLGRGMVAKGSRAALGTVEAGAVVGRGREG